jgi:hypothetical protein
MKESTKMIISSSDQLPSRACAWGSSRSGTEVSAPGPAADVPSRACQLPRNDETIVRDGPAHSV